jgi:hypothetical protein
MIRTFSKLVLAAAAAFALPSCGGGGFDPASKIQGVRVLALKSDKPYAKPGDTVTVDMLAVDRRLNPGAPMQIFWLPLVCTNPFNDAYFGCFTPYAKITGVNGELGAGTGGVAVGAGDVTALLPKGPTFSYKIPTDAVSSHAVVPGSNGPYGISIIFYMACAGRVRFASRDEASANPQQVPLQCVDDDGKALTPDDYVIGFWRTYVYDDRTNANPVIESVKLKDQVIPPGVPVLIDPCTRKNAMDCNAAEFNVVVPPSSQEDKPYDPDAPKERVWVAAFSDVGSVDGAQKLLYDTKAGSITDNAIKVTAKREDGGKSGSLWLVVHDNRGGTAWTTIPLVVNAAP